MFFLTTVITLNKRNNKSEDQINYLDCTHRRQTQSSNSIIETTYRNKNESMLNMMICCYIFLPLFVVSSCTGFIIPSALISSKLVSCSSTRQKTNKNFFSYNSIETIKPLFSTIKDSEERVTEEELITNKDNDNIEPESKFPTRVCYWKLKAPKSKWHERILLEDLKIGQELSGYLVQELLDGKTGPKLFFECGIGRTNLKSGDWSIVNGMLRLKRSKISVTRKRAANFRKKTRVILYVSRIQKECGQLEVCSNLEDAEKYSSMAPKISVSSLKKGQMVTGEVVKLYPYGAIIDIGANRLGLLHITKVSQLMNQYINKEKGLTDAGLEKGAKVKLMVESIEKRRLSLDFTDDVKEDARKELDINKQQLVNDDDNGSDDNNISIDDDELASWAAYADQVVARDEKNDDDEADNDDQDEDDYEYDDKYDEEADIESALGLDMY